MTIFDDDPAASRKFLRTTAAVALATTAFVAATPAKADSCSSLASTFHRQNTTITTAQTVAAGTFVTPGGQSITGLPQFCRVAGFTTPTSDSHIQFEVWIPESGWNLKYLQAGCGGFCGAISYGSMAEPLRRGYAVAATDDGHQTTSDASWALGHPEKVVDFGYRSLKETTDVAKDVIFAFQHSGPQHSYFMGCSDGGREALMEAQRYPQDFDGIVAGSPANYWTHLFTGFVWDQVALQGISGGDLSQSDLNTLSSSVLAQCAGHDGGLSTDQFLNNPLACRFDPNTLSLSQDKVEAIKKISSGPAGIFPGYGVGSSTASNAADWPAWITGFGGSPPVAAQEFFGDNYFKFFVFPNSGWTPNSFTAAENAEQADNRTGAILNSIDPDLRPFQSHGGKLIQYVGWGDTAISPLSDIDYHMAVSKVMGGPDETREFYRLFMAPGVAHCSGGPGPNAFGNGVNGPNPSDPADDLLSALDNWVVNRVTPEQIIATKYTNDNPAQGVAFQRPLCTFPKFAKYDGKGSRTAAASFECVRPDNDDRQSDNDDRRSDNR